MWHERSVRWGVLVVGVVVNRKSRAYLDSLVTKAGGKIEDRFEGRKIEIHYDPNAAVFTWEVPDDVEGRSLLAPAAGSPPPAYSETFYEGFGRAADGKELASLREGRFVLLARPSRDELFDLSTDPGERIDVAMDHPERLAALRAELDRLRQTWSRSASQELDLNDAEREEHTNQLRALGYVQ